MNKLVSVLTILFALCSLHPREGSAGVSASTEGSQHGSNEDIVVLAPPRMHDGLEIGELFVEWGIRLSNEFGSPPMSRFVAVVPFLNTEHPYPWTTAVVNSPSEGGETGKFSILLQRPLRRVSLRMGSDGVGSDSVTLATATAFGQDGTVVDETSRLVSNFVPELLILEEEEGRSIHRIEVEYENPVLAHMLYLIEANFVNPPTFFRCIPQIAHGPLPGNRTLQTLVAMTNPAPLDVFESPHGSPELSLDFFDSAGAPLVVALNGEVTSQLAGPLLARRESKIFATIEAVSASGLDAGYACLTSNYPLELAAVFRVLDEDGGVVAEAGIDGQRPGHRFVGLLEKDPIEETNTALALANVSESETTAAVSFFLAPNTTFSAEVVLGPGEHGSWFADELSSQLADRDAVGTVEILSDQPIVGTILRTIRGVVSASLPLNRQRAADEE
jgi:hypothetical protein